MSREFQCLFRRKNVINFAKKKLIHRPSLTQDEVEEYSDYEYYHAEKLGKEGAPCEHVFKECKTSILDMFGGIYTPFFDGF